MRFLFRIPPKKEIGEKKPLLSDTHETTRFTEENSYTRETTRSIEEDSSMREHMEIESSLQERSIDHAACCAPVTRWSIWALLRFVRTCAFY